MILVGLSGPIGHGKTTFAQALAQTEPQFQTVETYQVVAEVANSLNRATQPIPTSHDIDELNEWLSCLPKILKQVVHIDCDFEKIKLTKQAIDASPGDFEKLFDYVDSLGNQPELLEQAISEANKASYRSILQWLGGYLVTRVDKGIWYKELLRRSKVAEKSGKKLFIIGGVRFMSDADYVRAAGGKIILISRPGYAAQDVLDPTERERDQIVPDSIVMNDGTIDQLAVVAQQLWRDLKVGKLQDRYSALDAR